MLTWIKALDRVLKGEATRPSSLRGGRIDLGVLSRTDQVWTSDNTDPVDRIGIQAGFSHAYPATAMAAWATDSPNPITHRETPLRFRFHVAMAGALGIGGNLSEWSEAELTEAAPRPTAVSVRTRPATCSAV